MTPKGKRKRATAHLAAALILTCYFAHTVDCYRPKKADRREGREEADAAGTTGVREGRIVFGRVFDSGSGLESRAGTKRSSSNASVEDEATYQADFAGRDLLKLCCIAGFSLKYFDNGAITPD